MPTMIHIPRGRTIKYTTAPSLILQVTHFMANVECGFMMHVRPHHANPDISA